MIGREEVVTGTQEEGEIVTEREQGRGGDRKRGGEQKDRRTPCEGIWYIPVVPGAVKTLKFLSSDVGKIIGKYVHKDMVCLPVHRYIMIICVWHSKERIRELKEKG